MVMGADCEPAHTIGCSLAPVVTSRTRTVVSYQRVLNEQRIYAPHSGLLVWSQRLSPFRRQRERRPLS